MSTDAITQQEKFQSYQILCQFCAQLLLGSPEEELIEQLIEHKDLLLQDPFITVAKEEAVALHTLFSEAQEQGAPGIQAFLQAARQDYAYLFYMVAVSHTSPYESVYRTDDRTMFGPTTLEVREVYRRYGFNPGQEGSQPEDHVGTELSFLAALLGLGADAYEKQQAETTQQVTQEITQFLSAHILVFAPVYLKNVQVRAQEPLYRLVTALALSTIESLAAFFDAQADEMIEESAYLLTE